MNHTEFILTYRRQVSSINYKKQLNLAISICKRLYSDYVEFSEKYQWGNKDILLQAINEIEQSGANDTSQHEINSLLIQIDSITPDTDDFGSDTLGSYALNACVAIHESLQFIQDKSSDRIITIGTCMTDTIDFKIQEQQTLSQREIDTHPLMIEVRSYLLEKSK